MYFAYKLVFIVLVAVFLQFSRSANIPANNLLRIKRSNSESTANYCKDNSPCGWASYNDQRVVIYVIKNRCECPDGLKCLRTDDSLPMRAFIYRCKSTDTNIEK